MVCRGGTVCQKSKTTNCEIDSLLYQPSRQINSQFIALGNWSIGSLPASVKLSMIMAKKPSKRRRLTFLIYLLVFKFYLLYLIDLIRLNTSIRSIYSRDYSGIVG